MSLTDFQIRLLADFFHYATGKDAHEISEEDVGTRCRRFEPLPHPDSKVGRAFSSR